MALSTPQLQPRSRSPRDWGNFVSPTLLPNASGAPLPARQFALEAGDTAFVIAIGQFICMSAGTTGAGDAAWAVSSATPIGGFNLFDDFISLTGVGNTGFTATTAGGAGAAVAAVSPTPGDLAHPGVMRLGTGTSVAGRAQLTLGATRHLLPGPGGSYAFETLVQLPILATAADDYLVALGLSDNVGAGFPTNGIIWRYDLPSLTWDGVLRIGGVDVATVVGPAVAAGSWVKLRIEYNSVTGITFSIALPSPGLMVVIGTIPAAVVAPLLLTAGFSTSMKMQKTNLLVGLNRDLLCDYVMSQYIIGTPSR